MFFDIFPFEMVPKGCKLAIYGFGRVGQQFIQQIEKKKWCELLFVVDREADRYNVDFVKVVKPDYLYNFEEEKYDYVLISVKAPSLSNEIKASLIRNGIDEEKILLMHDSSLLYIDTCGERIDICEKDIFNNKNKVVKYLSKYYSLRKGRALSTDEYFPALLDIVLNNKGNESFLEAYKSVLKGMRATEEKIIAIRLLFDVKIYDVECIKMMVQTLKEYEWKDDTPFGLTFDIAQMIFEQNRTDCLYPQFYTDIRELYKKIKEYYNIQIDSYPQSRKVKKVALLCHYFGELQGNQACIDLDIQYANQIHDAGYEVRIFVSNAAFEDLEDSDIFLFKVNRVARNKYVKSKALMRRLRPGIKVEYFPFVSVKEGLTDFSKKMDFWKPDVLLNVADEIGIEAFIYYGIIPTVFLPFRGYQTCMFCDTYITPTKKMCLKENAIYHSLNEENIYETNLSNTVENDSRPLYRRGDYLLNENDFLIISVGRRLLYELDNELIDKTCELLKKYEDIKWILVGDDIFIYQKKAQELIKSGRIIFWGYEEYIESLYSICDIYLEPNRQGGAHSVRLAMLQGLPIALTDYASDISSIMSEEDMIHGDYKELLDDVEKLYLDKEYYSKKSKRSLEIMKKLDPKDDGKKIMEICEKTVSRFWEKEAR